MRYALCHSSYFCAFTKHRKAVNPTIEKGRVCNMRMNGKFFIRCFGMALVASMLLFGLCATDMASAADGGKPTNSVTIANRGEVSTLLSWEANDQSAQSVSSNLYDTLIRRETSGELVPGLATEWSYNADRTEITFTLRKGVKFHNGDVMTADDVVFSLNQAIGSRFAVRMTGAFQSAEKVDEDHVKLILKFPYAPAEGCVTSVNCGVVSKKAFEANPDGFSRNPVGTGPYKFVEWKSGESVTMEAFEDYFREPAAIKKVVFRVIPDMAAALVALETGQIDVFNNPATSDFEYIKGNSNLQFKSVPSTAFYFLAFNNTNGLFAENKVLREAAAYALDTESILIGALDGNGVLTASPIPHGVKFCPEDFEGFTFDLEKSQKLLEDNGFKGQKITLLCMEAGYDVPVAQVVVEQLRRAGFDAELTIMERTAFLADVYNNSQFEICINSVTAFYPDADFITYMRYHSKHMGGGNNFVMANYPKMDETLDKARVALSDEERAQLYREVSQIVKDEAIIAPIMSYMVSLAAHKDLKGMEASNVGRIYAYDFSW